MVVIIVVIIILPPGTAADPDLQAGIDLIRKISQSALFTTLRQEIDRFNGLLHLVHTSLKSLALAVRGEVVMSEGLEEAYYALLSQRVPAQWKVGEYKRVI